MCTAFAKKGDDLFFGYNLDLGLGVWDYKIYAKNNAFYVGIKVNGKVYKTHGVTCDGRFACLPYMNELEKGVYKRGKNHKRIDLLVDEYIGGKLDFAQLSTIAKEKQIVNVPNCSMHSLIGDKNGNILLLEAGIGTKEIAQDFALIANFSALDTPKDLSSPFYGYDRYCAAKELLDKSKSDFSVKDGLNVLKASLQKGEWATRVSFLYSTNDNSVYYALNGDFDNILVHRFPI